MCPEAALNPVLLRYFSYFCVAAAVYFYFALRLNWLSSSRITKLLLFALFNVLACVAWHAQLVDTREHSPRQLIMGTVTSLNSSTHRDGSLDDAFQLKLAGGTLSPRLSADYVAAGSAQQPIRPGDVLGVYYRTWDNVPLTIDVLEGPNAGWHYTHRDSLDAFVWTVGGAGLLIFVGALFGIVLRRA